MNFKANIKKGKFDIQIFENGEICQDKDVRYYCTEMTFNNIIKSNLIEENCKHIHGIAIKENENYIRIYNDPFCSCPIYIIASSKDSLFVTTQFEDVYQHSDLHLDYTGVYELMWIGQVFHDRTIVKEVKQLPAACFCEINKETMQYTIEPYYNFDIKENVSISNQNKANEIVYHALKEIWKRYKDKKILMGLSGGMDSRLSACLLSEYFDKNNSMFFTFGYSKYIKEYDFAKRVTKKLQLKPPRFVKLSYEKYREAEQLAVKTGGHVGIVHGHTYECLKELIGEEDMLFVSNYYSDAVMGWDAKKEKVLNEEIEEIELVKKVYLNQCKLPEKIAKTVISEAINDIEKIFNRYDPKSNFSCFEEFYYVVERNTKFHLRSAYQCNDIIKTDIPFADFKLLEKCISVPLRFRWEKRLESEIISSNYFNMNDISSRRYFERSKTGEQEYSFLEKAYYFTGVYGLKTLNFVNLILAKFSRNRVQIINPYQTECQRLIFDKYYKVEFKEDILRLEREEIINKRTCEQLTKEEFRSTNVGLKFTIIGLSKIIEKLKIRDNNMRA